MIMEKLIKLWKFGMNLIYRILRFFPQQDKITFISRQHDFENIDFKLLRHKIEKKHPEIKCVVLAKMIHPGLISKVKYIFHMFRQMYHLATSRIVILDTYCILVSILKHRPELKIIQMWHALGALKQFGYSTLDKGEGTSRAVAELMEMHKNYTYVCASSENCIPFFAEAFNVPEEKVKVLPLPSTDLLVSTTCQNRTAERIYESYPALKSRKKKVLYAPTFRKNEDIGRMAESLIRSLNPEIYDIIIKFHPLTKTEGSPGNVFELKEFETYEAMSISDYVITDYSAVVFDAVLMKKPLFFFAYDLDKYMEKRNFYIDYMNEMPGVIGRTSEEISRAISENDYDMEKEDRFRERFIAATEDGYVNDWVKFIEELRES